MFADAFASLATAFGAPFHAGKARWPGTPVIDDGGSIVTPGTPIERDCTVQVDAATEAMRVQEGFKGTDVRLLVLTASLASDLDTRATVEVLAGPHAGSYSVQSVGRDPVGIAWDCRGRRTGEVSGQPIIRSLSGGITGDATLYAALQLRAPLLGGVFGASAIAGALTSAPADTSILAGGVTGFASLAGAVQTKAILIGGVLAAGDMSGALTSAARLAGQANGSGVVTGTLITAATLAGQASGGGVVAATMTTSAAIAGQVFGVGTIAGTLIVSARLAGAVVGAGDVQGTLTNQAGAAYDTDAQSYFAAMTVQPNAARKGLINDLIVGLKSDGVWAALDWLVLLAAHDAQAGRLNARNTSKLLSAVNSPTFTADRGYMGDGSTAHLDFGELWSATGNQYAQDSATIGAWCNLMGAGTALTFHMGVTGGVQRATVRASGANANETFQINDATAEISRAGNNDRRGHRASVRTGATIKRAYKEGALLVETATASTAAPGTNGALLRGGTTYSNDRLAVAYSGGGITSAQALAIHNRLNTFLTAIGAN